jgi:hypothetical protein
LVITSRHPFTLNGLEKHLFELPLPQLSDAAQRKLELRQKETSAEGVSAEHVTDEGQDIAQKHLQDLQKLSKDLHPSVLLETQRSIMDSWLKSRGLSGFSFNKRRY